jgi:hypothetical protein
MRRHADRVAARLLERLRDAKRGFNLGNRVAHDEVHARGTAVVVEHGQKVWVKRMARSYRKMEWCSTIEFVSDFR